MRPIDIRTQPLPPCTVTIGARAAHGTAIAPPSKSVSHRMLIAAALAKGESILLPACNENLTITPVGGEQFSCVETFVV
jgi:hypothetical protein